MSKLPNQEVFVVCLVSRSTQVHVSDVFNGLHSFCSRHVGFSGVEKFLVRVFISCNNVASILILRLLANWLKKILVSLLFLFFGWGSKVSAPTVFSKMFKLMTIIAFLFPGCFSHCFLSPMALPAGCHYQVSCHLSCAFADEFCFGQKSDLLYFCNRFVFAFQHACCSSLKVII